MPLPAVPFVDDGADLVVRFRHQHEENARRRVAFATDSTQVPRPSLPRMTPLVDDGSDYAIRLRHQQGRASAHFFATAQWGSELLPALRPRPVLRVVVGGAQNDADTAAPTCETCGAPLAVDEPPPSGVYLVGVNDGDDDK